LVHGGKGDKDRVTMLPDKLKLELQRQLEVVRQTWREDAAAGHGKVWLPEALRRKVSEGGTGMGLAMGVSIGGIEP
jgi:hypothetical protein